MESVSGNATVSSDMPVASAIVQEATAHEAQATIGAPSGLDTDVPSWGGSKQQTATQLPLWRHLQHLQASPVRADQAEHIRLTLLSACQQASLWGRAVAHTAPGQPRRGEVGLPPECQCQHTCAAPLTEPLIDSPCPRRPARTPYLPTWQNLKT